MNNQHVNTSDFPSISSLFVWIIIGSKIRRDDHQSRLENTRRLEFSSSRCQKKKILKNRHLNIIRH